MPMTATDFIDRVEREARVSRAVAARAVADACSAVLDHPREIAGDWWGAKILTEAVRLARAGERRPTEHRMNAPPNNRFRLRAVGCAWAHAKYRDAAYPLPRAEFAALRDAWMAGAAFYVGTSVYGAPLILRLGDIVAIEDASPECMRARRESDFADEREDAREARDIERDVEGEF